MYKLSKTNKTKRKKKSVDKKKLWQAFDSVNNIEDKQKNMELLYSKQDNTNRTHCDSCGSVVKFDEKNLLICSNTACSIIYKDCLDDSPEWRYYGADDNNSVDPTRCGMPINPLLKESSYGCKVVCNSHSSYEMRKIRKYTEWQSMPYKEKSQYDEFLRIKQMSQIAGIPKIIIDEALRQHKKLSGEKTFRGVNRSGIIAAAIYIAGRIHNYPRTAKEIATIFHLDNTSATKGCKNAVHILNIMESRDRTKEQTHFHRTTPKAFIERYCSKLNMNQELTKVCAFVAMKIEQNDLIPENTPHSVAAGIVYFVAQSCNINITKKMVHACSEISEVTINKCYKKLEKMKEKLIPSIILQKYNDQ